MALPLVSLKTGRDPQSKYGPLGAAVMGIYVAVGLILTISFALSMLLLMSPELLKCLLRDVIKWEDFPGYLSPNSTAAVNVEYSGHTYLIPSPPAPIPHRSADNTLNTTMSNVTLDAGESSGRTPSSPEDKKLRVLLGVFVMAWTIKQRNLIRMAYGMQSSKDAVFTIRFIMGALKDGQEYYQAEVDRDNATFGDIIVLDCAENMDEGKTFTFFSSLPGIVGSGSPYDYVMKLDDDAYIRTENLGKRLKALPRTDLYYGYSLPCGNQNPYAGWMAGAGYLVSWDLVQWIAESPIPRSRSVGVEDKLTRDWFNEGGVAKNRATNFGLFYDHLEYGGDKKCAHELRLDSILIHKLKTVDQWHQVLAFFYKDGWNSPP